MNQPFVRTSANVTDRKTLAPEYTAPQTEEQTTPAHRQCAKVCVWALTSVSGRLKINAPWATCLTLIMGKVMTL